MRWYVSAAAVKQYMAVAGYPAEDDGEWFDRAERELADLADESRLAKDVGPGQRSQQWRVKATIKGRRTRLELVVAVEQRAEGDLPQLIAVRNKGA
jgi:hypothetical protein